METGAKEACRLHNEETDIAPTRDNIHTGFVPYCRKKCIVTNSPETIAWLRDIQKVTVAGPRDLSHYIILAPKCVFVYPVSFSGSRKIKSKIATFSITFIASYYINVMTKSHTLKKVNYGNTQ